MQMETREITIGRKGAMKKIELPTEGTVLVPDIKPDVAEVLKVIARAVLDKADCENGRLTISGRFFYTVLYRPEDTESVLCAVSGSMPFSGMEMTGDIAEDMTVHFGCAAPFAAATMLNSRKLAVRGVVEVTAQPYYNEQVTMLAPDTEGICTKRRQAEGFSLVAEAQSRIHLTERLSVPAGELPIRELLFCDAAVQDFTVKVVDNKAVIKGEIQMTFLYQPEESLAPVSFEEVFEIAEIQDIPGIAPQQDYQFELRMEEFSAEAAAGENGQNFDVVTEISLLFSCIATEPMELDCITDGFVPGEETMLSQKEMTVQTLLPVVQIPVSVKERMTLAGDMLPISRVLRLQAVPSLILSDDQMKCELMLELLYQDASGAVCYTEQPVSAPVHADVPQNSVCDGKIRLTKTEYVISGETGIEVRCALAAELQGMHEQTLSVVTAMEISEEELPKRPSVVICFVSEGDTLWDVAKRYKITEEEILSANALPEGTSLSGGQRLLIPRTYAE